MTSAITFTGLGSGIDFASIIDSMVDVERKRYIEPYENWKQTWSDKITAFQNLNTKLAALHTTVKSLDTKAEFLDKNASSSDDDVVSATANSLALNGSYAIEVGTDIKHRLGSDGKADSDTTNYASSGDTIQITVGSNTESIIINGGDYTLEGIASEINSESAYVTAEVIDDGSADNNYRLVLTSKSGGEDNRIVMGTNTTNIDFTMSGAGDRIDDMEGSLNGTSTVTSGGQYLGTTNKTFQFKISGSDTYTVGTDSFEVTWTDNEGNNGTISVSSTDPVTVFQGVTLQFSSGTVKGGDEFSVDVWNPDLQAPQDDGLAKTEKEYHSGFVDEDTTAVTSLAGGDKTFSYTYNGQRISVSVDGGTTLKGLVKLINNDADNPGVRASIVNDGTGLSTSYHLVLTGEKTGAAYKIEDIEHDFDNFSGSGTGAGGGFSETQSAQNAMLKVEGYPTGSEYIQRFSNTIGDIITGVSLNVKSAGTATIVVESDTAAVKEKIRDFVASFNEVRNYIQELTYYDDKSKTAGILIDNYGIDTIKNRLNSIVSTKPLGFRDGYDTYVNFAQIGITTDATEGSETQGDLVINEAMLDTALSNDLDAVADLFSESFYGRSVTSKMDYSGFIPGITKAGTFEVFFDASDPSASMMRIKGGEWHTATWTSSDNTLTGASDSPESGLVVKINDTSADFTGEVDLKLGYAGTIKEELDFLTSPSYGPLAVLEDNYQEIIDNIDKKIDFEERRIALYEQRLKERYSRLEGVLTELNGQSAYLSKEIDKLKK